MNEEQKKCTCIYGKDGKQIGLCLRCAKRETEEHSRGYDHAFVDLVKYLNGKKPTDRFTEWVSRIDKEIELAQQQATERERERIKDIVRRYGGLSAILIIHVIDDLSQKETK